MTRPEPPEGYAVGERDHLLRLLTDQMSPAEPMVLELREGRATLWDHLHVNLLPRLHERPGYQLNDFEFCEAMLLQELFTHHTANTQTVRQKVHIVRGSSPEIDKAFWAAVTKLEAHPVIEVVRPPN